MKTLTVKITGMHCTSCAMNIDCDLEDLHGVNKSSTNYARQQTEVTFDPEKVKIDKIFRVIKELGYDAQPL